MKRLIIVFIAASALFTAPAYAWQTPAVQPLGVKAEGGRVYVVSASTYNPDGCQSPNFILLQGANTDETNRFTSLAITALTAGKPLSFWIVGCFTTAFAGSVPIAVIVNIGS